jgi:hypothetical protein
VDESTRKTAVPSKEQNDIFPEKFQNVYRLSQNKDIFKGVTLHLLARIIADSPLWGWAGI